MSAAEVRQTPAGVAEVLLSSSAESIVQGCLGRASDASSTRADRLIPPSDALVQLSRPDAPQRSSESPSRTPTITVSSADHARRSRVSAVRVPPPASGGSPDSPLLDPLARRHAQAPSQWLETRR